MSQAPKESAPRTSGGLARWHRRVGVTLAVVFLGVVATGLLLNHAEDLGLRRVIFEARWLYRWYGMEPAGEPVSASLGPQRAVWLDGTLYLDAAPVGRIGELRGASKLPQGWVAAARTELVWLTDKGDVIERLDEAALPTPAIARVGVTREDSLRAAIEAEDGAVFVADADLVRWTEAPRDLAVNWSTLLTLGDPLREQIIRSYRGEGLSLHRVILDLHSGRFFGRAGVVVVDVAALGLLFLTLSGITMALRGRR